MKGLLQITSGSKNGIAKQVLYYDAEGSIIKEVFYDIKDQIIDENDEKIKNDKNE